MGLEHLMTNHKRATVKHQEVITDDRLTEQKLAALCARCLVLSTQVPLFASPYVSVGCLIGEQINICSCEINVLFSCDINLPAYIYT